MKIFYCLIFYFFLCNNFFSQNIYRYKIEFTDKNNSPFSLSNPSQYLSQRAISRRNNQNIPVAENDLPVNQNYIDSILNSGNVQLLNRSKWLNAITISTDDSSLIDLINTFSFVKNSQLWKKTKSNFSEGKLKVNNEKIFQEINSSYDYGAAFNQIDMINVDFLHDLSFRGEGMLIAVLDAGFTSTDTMLAFNHLYQTNRIVATKNFVDGTNSVYNSATHGTFVLSTMAANLPSLIIGTAPEASYMLLISEDIFSETVIEEFNWVSAAEFADSAGVDIINSSLGYTTFDSILVDSVNVVNPYNHTYSEMNGNTAVAAIGADIAASKGMLVVVSAGNSGSGQWNYIGVPADADSILAVGAVDADKNYASFSSNGPSSDGQVKPAVAAQGQGTVLASTNDSIFWGSGTSFSSPIIAGAAACFWQSAQEKTNMEIIDLIQKSASQYSNPDTLLGYGIPDFEKAYELLTNKIFVDSDSFVVYPNPFSDELTIDFYSPDKKTISVALFDVTGKIVFSYEKKLVEGLNKITIEKNICSGNTPYILQFTAGETLVKKIIVKI